MPVRSTPVTSDAPIAAKAVYEPPQLVEIGGFAEVTRGTEGGPSDYPYFSIGYWLI